MLYDGKVWTRNGVVLQCEDGRRVYINEAMTDEYLLELLQRLDAAKVVIEQRAADELSAKRIAAADNVLRYLMTHSPAEIEDYVQANVTDLASARAVLKKLAVAVSVLGRNILRDD